MVAPSKWSPPRNGRPLEMVAPHQIGRLFPKFKKQAPNEHVGLDIFLCCWCCIPIQHISSTMSYYVSFNYVLLLQPIPYLTTGLIFTTFDSISWHVDMFYTEFDFLYFLFVHFHV
jgi:hypothetical protein